MSLHFTRASLRMFAHRSFFAIAVAAMILSLNPVAFSQKDNKTQTQSGASNVQRMDIMRSRLEALKRSLDSAVAAIKSGVEKVSFVDGRTPHSVLLEIFTDEGVGTEVVM